MEPATQNTSGRSLLIYAVIGAVLVAAVVLGVLWTKQRSEQVATGDQQVAQEQTDTENEAQPNRDETAGQNDEPQPHSQPAGEENEQEVGGVGVAGSSTPPDQSLPNSVPSTGAGSIVLPTVALVLCVLAAGMYVRSRRRLSPISE